MSFDNNIKIYEAYNAHSQMMRKALCSRLGRTDGDWKLFHDSEVSSKTIEMWK